MATGCNQCGAILTDGDKFCGDCGAPVIAPPSPMMTAPSAIEPPPQSVTPSPSTANKTSKSLMIGLMLGGVVLGIGGALAGVDYYSDWFGGDAINTTAGSEAKLAEKPAPNSIETPPASSEAELEPVPQPSSDGYVIEPGKWVFDSEVTRAILIGTNTPARPNGRNLLGHKNRYEVCISETKAKTPDKQILIPGLGRDCVHGGAQMTDGKYRGELTCAQPPDGPGYTVRMAGSYERKKIELTTDSDVQIGQGVGESEGKAIAALTAVLSGRHVGPC